ncbi:hypothetical protein NC653_038048 [Populus alba x Populus x berolinensis]|uniref:Uncharacterized protein n=1 Tax=Populus alba x Populus x berolinensis TaxID=444605 RepID=A0AAD6LFV9_9ROSI|nr:hypothetical protein NC653_038048 [Populus alba x Populus x berolinensis]
MEKADPCLHLHLLGLMVVTLGIPAFHKLQRANSSTPLVVKLTILYKSSFQSSFSLYS